MVRILLAGGAITDSRSRHGRTPLHWAAIKGHAGVVSLLLSYGADHEARDAKDGHLATGPLTESMEQ